MENQKQQDSNYTGNLKDMKSITKYYFFIGRIIVIQCNKQQYTSLISILEFKYIAVSQNIKEENMDLMISGDQKNEDIW